MYISLKANRDAKLLTGPPLSCQYYFMRNLFIFLPCEDYLDALQDTILWRLHPFNVMAQLIFDFICLVAENAGRATGRMTTSIFYELPWIYQLPAFLLLILTVITTILTLKGYWFSVGYGFLQIYSQPNQQDEQRVE
uniref:Uncharacterized protein n=1 Tax=Acrobeloides nanus TaxID=290746 RepID=A0A914C7Q5_9BILA